jgi:ribulose-phosphate 3-epimerase
MSLRIAPSILDADWLELSNSVSMLEKGNAAWLHLDVMDGHFVPNITFGPVMARAIAPRTHLPMEAHLMVTRPDDHIEPFVKAGVKRIIVHVEGNPHLHRLVQKIRELGAQPGVVLNPGTGLGSIEEILQYVDLVLLMSVNPGWGGQKFIPATLRKIEKLRKMIEAEGRPIDLEVDGGVNHETIASCAKAGADLFVVGSAIFKAKDQAAALADLANMAPGGKSK